ncbi:hypothetical protein MNBD_ALPHA03-1019 [hydrothermal vent metagenome]|uniref:Alginate export domain-containing protein n=1 Tax=hydrothermal vent metagenome TaxID=652676 RepID=A0A3B1ALF2_9ZZZZ
MIMRKFTVRWGAAIFSLLISCGLVQASPWAAVGDMQLRNDVEILARHGVISGPVNTWPLSWKQITRNLPRTSEMDLPPYVRHAVIRVKEKIPGKFRTAVRMQTTNNPAIVRGFASTARNDLDMGATLEYNNDSGTTIHIQGGYRKGNGEDYVYLDGSYLSQDIGNWSAYAGAFDRWWGPGRESTLLLSNNARPMPSVGLRRIEPKAFKTKWLSWMGPWQWDMFVARMEKERFVPNALIAGMRLSFEPVKNFEVGLSRTLQLCGDGRPCGFSTWANALISVGDLDNTGTVNEPGNQLASIDLAYSFTVGRKASLKIYAEGTAEDQNIIMPFQFARLLGASIYGPYGGNGAQWRLTTEFSDTASKLAWLFGKTNFNVMYNNFIYRTGYRYNGRTLGSSLDNDSKLFSVTANFTSANDWNYTVKYHNAQINTDGGWRFIEIYQKNKINLIEGQIAGNINFGNVEINGRWQDDDLNTPNVKSSKFDASVVWIINF